MNYRIIIAIIICAAAVKPLDAAPRPAPMPYGNGTITRSQDGKTTITTPYGRGTISRTSDGKTAITSPYGHGSLTRTSDGKTYTTNYYGRTPPKKP